MPPSLSFRPQTAAVAVFWWSVPWQPIVRVPGKNARFYRAPCTVVVDLTRLPWYIWQAGGRQSIDAEGNRAHCHASQRGKEADRSGYPGGGENGLQGRADTGERADRHRRPGEQGLR